MKKLLMLFALATIPPAVHAAEPAPPAAPAFKKEDLQRVDTARGEAFAWAAAKPPATPANPQEAQATGMVSLSGGDTKVICYGPFAREIKAVDKPGGGKASKEIFTLATDLKRHPTRVVELEQTGATPDLTQILRGQTIKASVDLASGNMEMLEAIGAVEIYTKERKARGEGLVFETQYGAKNEVLKNMVVVRGDKDAGKRATVWSGDDKIQAYRFEMNLRLDTFKASGSAIAELSIAQATAPAGDPGKPAGGGFGALPGLSLSGGKVLLTCDGELHYEGAAGRVRITRNVAIVKEGLRMTSDEMLILLQVDEFAGGKGAAGGVFSGSLKTMDCTGRIEIITAENVIQCDKMVYDLANERLRLEMKDPSDLVKIYDRDTAFPNELRGRQVTTRQGRIDVDTKRGTIVDLSDKKESPKPMSIQPFTALIPSLRASRPPAPAKP